MCTVNTFADLFCVEVLKRYIFSEFSVYIRKVLSIERGFFAYFFYICRNAMMDKTWSRKWEYICILGICASTHMPSPGLSADIRRIHLSEREKLWKTYRIRRASNVGVSATIRRKKSEALSGICASTHMIGSGISADKCRIHTNWTREASRNI